MAVGCTGSQDPGDGLQQLDARARVFWSARIVGDPVAAYEYEEVKARQIQPLQAYVRAGGVLYRKAEVRGVELAGNGEARVRVDVEYVVPGLGGKPIAAPIEDFWVLVEGQWYHRAPDRLRKGRVNE